MTTSVIRYRDRETGELLEERVFGEGELRWFYGGALGRALTRGVFSRGPFNRLYGYLQRRPASRRKILGFVERLGIDPGEAALDLSEYASLDAFFSRRLRAGARPVDADPDHLLSPADGRALVIPHLAVGEPLRVKRSQVALSELLGDAELAAGYTGGAAVVVRLAPADYHRFHFPTAGEASPATPHPGPLHSVHPIALLAGAPSFKNKRSVTLLRTEAFGRLALIEVGAMVVGTIVQSYQPGPVLRGAEKGAFHFGGSTVVLLIEPGRAVLDEDLVAASAGGLESYVKCGSRIAVRGSP